MSLQRFHDAQADADSGYEAALAEMRSGRKRKHWIWYIFPQLAGLGRSGVAQFYGPRALAEACPNIWAPRASRKGANTSRIRSCVPATKKSLPPSPNNYKPVFPSSA